MPVYTLETLLELKDSELVTVPEFKWNDIEKVEPSANGFGFEASGRRRSSHHAKRPAVMPKAAIPFSQRAMRDGDKEKAEVSNENEDAEGSDEDEDAFAARYLLRSKPKTKKPVEEKDDDGAPVVNLKYAAALAASMKMADPSSTEGASAVAEEEAPEQDDGWVSVQQNRQRRTRKGGSFSKWHN